MQIHHAITKEKLVTCFEVIKALAASYRGKLFGNH